MYDTEVRVGVQIQKSSKSGREKVKAKPRPVEIRFYHFLLRPLTYFDLVTVTNSSTEDEKPPTDQNTELSHWLQNTFLRSSLKMTKLFRFS